MDDIIGARRKAATFARAYLGKKITCRQFMDSFSDMKDDEMIDELIDLIEHEPKRGGFMGISEKEWQQYQTSINDLIDQLEK